MTRMLWNYEWRHNRRIFVTLLALMPFYFIWMSNSIPETKLFLLITALMSSFLPFSLMLREDKFKAQALVCSLPVKRAQIIRMRYGILWLAALAFLLMILAVVFISPFSKVDGGAMLTTGGLFYFFAVTTLIIAVLYPFSVYFGAMGFIIVLVAFQFLGIGLQALIVALGWGRDLMSFPRAIAASLHASRIALGEPLFYGVLLILIVSLNAISLIVSIRLFQNKEI